MMRLANGILKSAVNIKMMLHLVLLLIVGILTLSFVTELDFLHSWRYFKWGIVFTVVATFGFHYLALNEIIQLRFICGVLCVLSIYSFTYIFSVIEYNGLFVAFSILGDLCVTAITISIFGLFLFLPFSISVIYSITIGGFYDS